MAKRTKKQAKSRLLKVEALEQRQLLAGGFTSAQGQEFSDIVHPNGNVYDQVLLKSSSINITNDPGQITRVSFLDLQGDIVQVEFGGSGTLSISLDASTFKSGVAPTGYNQTGINYVQGLASITISGSDATTNLNVFTVGSATAVNQSLFDSTHTGGNNVADIQRVTVVANPANPNGSTFGSIFAGNVNFTGSTGPVGITAANVQVQGVVNVGDINATGSGIPTLVFGTASQFGSVNVTGGDLLSPNGAPINNNGSYLYTINLTAGTLSNGTTDAAENTYSQLSFTGQNPVTATTKTFTLTTGVDSIVGTSGNDAINAQLGAGATLTALDSIDGGGGNDTLSINDVTGSQALPGGLTLKNVETINLASTAAATIDTSASSVTGVTALNVLTSNGNDIITAGAGQAVTVFDTAGTVTLTGGSTQNVTTKGNVVLSGATGAVTATDLGQNAGSTINGGTSVSLTTTIDASAAQPTVAIGGTTAPTGAVTLTETITGDKVNDKTAGTIAVTGGTTVTVTENNTQPANSAGATSYTLTQGAVSVTGSTATTSVTVSQAAPVTKVDGVAAIAAVAGTTETATVKFGALTAGQTITFGGLTYKAGTTGSTATQVATAFANISAGSGMTGWTTGTLGGGSSDTVTFTSTGSGDVADLANTGTGAVTSISKVDGVAAVAATAATAAKGGIVDGAITITDTVGAGGGTISTVSLTNYAAGATITSGALTNLSLTGSGGAVTINNTAAKTLDLTVNGVTGGTPANATYTTLNVHTTGADSTLANFTGAGVTTLNLDGTKKLTMTSTAGLSSLATVNVSGSASVSLPALGGTVTTVNAAATSGSVTVAGLDSTAVTYSGGSGTDSVTITNATAPTKAIDGGAGSSDTVTLNFAGGYTSSSKITGFETLALGASADASNYDATGFNNLATGNNGGTAPTFTNVGTNANLTLSAVRTGNLTVSLKDSTGTSDSLAVSLTGGSGNYQTLTANGVESISLANATNNSTIALTDDKLTAVTITGSKTMALTTTAPTLTSVDASAATGALTYTTTGVAAVTVKGTSAADSLTAAAGTVADTLIGNAGNDTLTSNAGLTVLTGGAGNDTFVIGSIGANVNVYTTTDASAGDKIQLVDTGTEVFNPNKLVLGSGTAVFQDYANAVVAAGGDASMNAYIGWFQFNGDTYIVESRHNGATTPSFVNGTDVVVKITGLVDLSQALVSTPGAGAPVIVVR